MNYKNVMLWPYEETEIRIEGGSAVVRTPWINGSLKVTVDTATVTEVERILRDGPARPEDLALVNQLCQPFAVMPAFYFLPRPNLKADKELHESRPLPASGKWDADFICASTAAGNAGFDPVSVWSYLRRMHLLAIVDCKEDINLAGYLGQLEGETLRRALISTLRQNHYVTVRCQEVLTPAIGLHSLTSESVEHFIAEESGHDLLLSRSLKHLGVEPESVPVLPIVEHLMNHFKLMATSNLIAFAFMVDAFERTLSAKKNPVVQGLERLGEHDAAQPLIAHLDINVDGEHDTEGLELLQQLGACDESYVRHAVNLCEVASTLILKLTVERIKILRQG